MARPRGRPKNMENVFTPRDTHKPGTKGYDSPRENIDPHIKTKVVDTKEIVQDGVAYDLSTFGAGSGDVTAAVNLTDETIVQGDGGAKGVKTSTATVAQIASNVAHVADVLTNPHAVVLNDLGNPDGDKDFNMTTRQLEFTWANPAGHPMTFEASGAYSGALLYLHQHTGNPGAGTYLLQFESTDVDVEHIKSIGPLATTEVLCTYVSGDTEQRFRIQMGGVLEWGAGGVTVADTNLYRNAANQLKTDDALHVTGNITTDGTVDGIDIATDVAANTLKDTNVTTDLSLGVGNATTEVIACSDGTDVTLIEADTDNAGLLGADKWDDIVANTAAKHTQGTDTTLGSGAVAADHGAAATDMVINVAYGTGAAPAANTTTIGSLYITHEA